MKSAPKKIFSEIMQQFQDQAKFKKLFKKAQSLYLMRSFKISSISSEEAIQSYQRLSNKYDSGQLKIESGDWHKNQRKLFIWYLICFCEQKRVSIQDLESQQWNDMSQVFWHKNPLFLKFQGLSILKNAKRHNWTNEDDELLKKFVAEIGSNEWNSISKSIFFEKEQGRFISPKQCRERWFNHICSQINKGQWTIEEDILILKYSIEKGKKWSAIARQLKTHRTQHMVKNRFNSIINKNRKKKMQNQQSLTRKALENLQKQRQQEEQDEQQNEVIQQKQKLKQQNIPIQQMTILKKQQQNSKKEPRVTRTRSKLEQNEQYKYNQGELKGLNQFVKNNSRGIIAFSNPEQLTGNTINIGNSNQTMDIINFSMTPNTPNSVKAISPMPSFTGQFYRNYGNYLQGQKTRQDGHSLFSPAGFISPGLGFCNPSPGFELYTIAQRYKQQKNVSNSRQIDKTSLQYPHVHSDLSADYGHIVNNKKYEQ